MLCDSTRTMPVPGRTHERVGLLSMSIWFVEWIGELLFSDAATSATPSLATRAVGQGRHGAT